MKASTILFTFALGAQSATSFTTTLNCKPKAAISSTARSMGLFDFFSDDARKERDERKQREIEEQERLQREIIARRSNPAKMEEYEAKVRVRRQLRMNGQDDAADSLDMYSGEDEKIVGLN
mmetsp:Transcript_44063/g.93812  ORF Transcript_44063/g.93812 Transcript_44063/m.93812 type:complete len:121 (-) Transcript_44063:250-612(-)